MHGKFSSENQTRREGDAVLGLFGEALKRCQRAACIAHISLLRNHDQHQYMPRQALVLEENVPRDCREPVDRVISMQGGGKEESIRLLAGKSLQGLSKAQGA